MLLNPFKLIASWPPAECDLSICPGSPGAGTARVTIVTRRVTRGNGDAPRDGDQAQWVLCQIWGGD